MIEFEYCEPNNLQELYSILANYSGPNVILAGGTDLINHIKIGKSKPSKVITLKSVKELSNKIEFNSKRVTIGAMVTLSDLEENQLIKQMYPALSQSAGKIGSKQIRNKGTLVGNICNASPAADTLPVLLIYNSIVNIAGRQSRRSIPIELFLKGPGKTDLLEGEIVESIDIPSPKLIHSSTYLKLSRREGVDLAIVGVATFVGENGELRVALGAVGPVSFRAYSAEKLLSEGINNRTLFEKGLDEAVKLANPITDLRATREYRLAMIKVFIRKAVQICVNELSLLEQQRTK